MIKPYYETQTTTLYQGDCIKVLKELPEKSVQCVITSPPYWGLRDYQIEGQMGLEATLEEYVAKMIDVFREVRRVLRDDGVVFLNVGDSYLSQQGKGFPGTGQVKLPEDSRNIKMKRPAGLKPKDLCGIPWRLALALQAEGWYLRSDIIWAKPNPMPESVTDRPTKSHEYVFLLTKKPRYFYDANAVRENSHEHSTTGRNKRTVWIIPTESFPGAHFATFPTALVIPCILAGTSEKGCCPGCGAPWKRVVEKKRIRTRPGKESKSYDRTTGEIVDDGKMTRPRSIRDVGERA